MVASPHAKASLRSALLSSAGLVLLVATGGAAQAACSASGSTVTCTGNVSAGVDVSDPYTQLNVDNLTKDITPASGVDGIKFDTSNGAVTLNVNTMRTISVHGLNANGIEAKTFGSYPLAIDETATINSAAGYGIDAESDTSLNLIGHGAITAGLDAILAEADVGPLTIHHSGKLTSTGAMGIYALATDGAVGIADAGAIVSKETGISAESDMGDVNISQTGNVTSSVGEGIDALSTTGAVSITVAGNITSQDDGIVAESDGHPGGVTISETGNIKSISAYGIHALATGGEVGVTVAGNVVALNDGIYAESDIGAVTIKDTGNITSTAGRGIFALATDGAVAVTVVGKIKALGDGIYVESEGHPGGVTLSETGNIKSFSGYGIFAHAPGGDVGVSVAGNIVSEADGIFAEADENGNVTINDKGNITSTEGSGVYAFAPGGTVDVTTAGNIKAKSDGIFAEAEGDKDVTVKHTGNITSTSGRGIYAYAPSGDVDVTAAGDIVSQGTGISAESDKSDGEVTINEAGKVQSSAGMGIRGFAADGSVGITAAGDIVSQDTGIYAEGDRGDVTIKESGAVNSAGGYGIYGYAPNGSVGITATGDITSANTGINALSEGGDVSIVESGMVDSSGGRGIYGFAPAGAVGITADGKVVSHGTGIFAEADSGDVTIAESGGVNSATGKGIYAFAPDGAVGITAAGNVTSQDTGIYAEADSGDVTISESGKVNSSAGKGIYAFAPDGAVAVTAGEIVSHGTGIDAEADVGDVVILDKKAITSATGDGIHALSASDSAVTVTTRGDISAAIDAIFASGYGAVDVHVNGGVVTGGALGAGVTIENADVGELTNHGKIKNAAGLAGLAVQSIIANTSIDNFGIITGGVSLAAGQDNSFVNHPKGLFNMGGSVDLGASWVDLTNDGVLSPGATGYITDTRLNGSLVNTVSGRLAMDFNLQAHTADRIDVSGDASLAGKLDAHFENYAKMPQIFTFLTTGGAITKEDLSFANPVVIGSIKYPNDQTADLVIHGFDFAPSGVTGNAKAIGDYLNNSSAPGLDPIFTELLNETSVGGVNALLNQLAPNVQLASEVGAIQNGNEFTDSLLSCRVADGQYFFSAEGECAWVRGGYNAVHQDATGSAIGFDDTSWNFAGGAQFALSHDWRVGFAVGRTTSTIDDEFGGHSTGDTVNFGAVVKYEPNALLLAAALSGSYGWYDATRTVSLGSSTEELTSHPTLGTFDGRLRAAYTVQSGNAYVKPLVDLDAIYASQSFTESGGAAALKVGNSSDTDFSVSPAVEAGTQVALGDGFLLRPFVRGGASFYTNSSVKLVTAFAADSLTAPFTATTSMDQVLWRLSAGLDVLSGKTSTLRLFYDGIFGDTLKSNAVGAKLSVNF